MNTDGSGYIIIKGDSFGQIDTNVTVYYGNSTSMISKNYNNLYEGENCYVKNTNIEIQCGAAAAKHNYGHESISIILVFQDQNSTIKSDLLNLRFKEPTYASVFPQTFEVLASTNFNLTGTNFGPEDSDVTVTYGNVVDMLAYTATSCTVVEAHVKISCNSEILKANN